MKAFFYRYRIPLIEWYFVAACCYFCVQGADMSMLIFPIFIGFVNTYLVEPIVEAMSEAGEEAHEEFLSKKPPTWKNIFKAYLLVLAIIGIYYLVNEFFFQTVLEPFSFGAIFWILDKLMGKWIKIWK